LSLLPSSLNRQVAKYRETPLPGLTIEIKYIVLQVNSTNDRLWFSFLNELSQVSQ